MKIPITQKGFCRHKVPIYEGIFVLAGNYKFMIMYGGEGVPGSPVTFTVEDKRSNELRVHGEGLKSGNVGDETVLIIEATHSEPTVKIRSDPCG